ncbi:MAG: asparagine synthase-related protein [Paludibacter sp.]|nr:asparagine synthase-related protein [Paludibacter sp.]
MHGFIVTISLKNESVHDLEYSWKPIFDFQNTHIKRNFVKSKINAEQYTSEKFINEKLWIDNDDFFIITEGLITNIDILCRSYKSADYEELIRTISKEKEAFFEDFSGNFVGFFWNKKTDTYLAFNNHTGTKKLFHYKSDDFIIFSTDLYTLSKTLACLNIKISLDTEASYLLLTSGFMHEDYTLIKEVKQIIAGQYANISNNTLKIKSYFDINEIDINSESEDNVINNLEKLFNESVQIEFDFEKKYDYTPLTTLSGGLDSRMVALVAHDLNFHNQQLLNFSEKGYADEVIAAKIASTYKMNITQISLSCEGLLAIDDVIAVNDGLTIYTGCSHVFEAIKKLTITDNIGIIHSGILGDGFMGSYLSSISESKPKISDGSYSSGLQKKAKNIIQESMSKYKTEELYKFYNRAFQGINNGFLFFDLIGEAASAFTYPPFVYYSFTIPRKIKYKKKIYIDWVRKKHPDYAGFVWESIGGKPTNNLLIRQFYRYKRAITKRLPIQSIWKNNMNPEQLWYDNNYEIKKYLDGYFRDNIHKFEFQKELMEDMTTLYTKGSITEKAQVLTLLGAYKLLF